MDKENKYISYWLLLITFLVGLMIVVGGLTRLTDSGLSITTWSLFSGILPPLSINEWENLFNLYKQIPEYKLLNSIFDNEEFELSRKYQLKSVLKRLGSITNLAEDVADSVLILSIKYSA